MSVETMPEFHRAIRDEEIKLTPAAKEQLAILYQQVDDDDVEAVRIYVTGGGCAGMSYGMTFSGAATRFDKVLDGPGFRMFVDAVAINYLKGAEIDYVDRPTGASFVFNNVFSATGGTGVCGGCGMAGGCGG